MDASGDGTGGPERDSQTAGLNRVYSEDRVLIGEIYLPLERLLAYYGEDLTGVHSPSTPTKRRCRMGPGPIGSWATTTTRAER